MEENRDEARMKNHWEIIGAGRIVSTTPEGLWQDACDYFRWCDDNPIRIKKTLVSGKDSGKKVVTEQPRPYTIKALCMHTGVTEDYLKMIRLSKDESNLYFITVSKILYSIYVQNMELAMVDVFNPVFTARVLNMEKEEAPTSAIKVEVLHNGVPTLSTSENQVLEKLEEENKLFEDEQS